MSRWRWEGVIQNQDIYGSEDTQTFGRPNFLFSIRNLHIITITLIDRFLVKNPYHTLSRLLFEIPPVQMLKYTWLYHGFIMVLSWF